MVKLSINWAEFEKLREKKPQEDTRNYELHPDTADLLRISVNSTSPYYYGNHPDWRGLTYFFNGTQLDTCVEVDVPEGWADVYDTDIDGHIVLMPDGKPSILRIHGRIEIRKRA